MKVLKENKNNTIKTKTCQPSLLYLNISKATVLDEKGKRTSVTSIKEKNCGRQLRG